MKQSRMDVGRWNEEPRKGMGIRKMRGRSERGRQCLRGREMRGGDKEKESGGEEVE